MKSTLEVLDYFVFSLLWFEGPTMNPFLVNPELPCCDAT